MTELLCNLIKIVKDRHPNSGGCRLTHCDREHKIKGLIPFITIMLSKGRCVTILTKVLLVDDSLCLN